MVFAVCNKYRNHLEQKLVCRGTKDLITWNKLSQLMKKLFPTDETIVGNCRNKKLYHWEQIFSSEGTYI
jgi:hypothetical protein